MVHSAKAGSGLFLQRRRMARAFLPMPPGGKVAEGYKNLTREVIKLEKQREKNKAGTGR